MGLDIKPIALPNPDDLICTAPQAWDTLVPSVLPPGTGPAGSLEALSLYASSSSAPTADDFKLLDAIVKSDGAPAAAPARPEAAFVGRPSVFDTMRNMVNEAVEHGREAPAVEACRALFDDPKATAWVQATSGCLDSGPQARRDFADPHAPWWLKAAALPDVIGVGVDGVEAGLGRVAVNSTVMAVESAPYVLPWLLNATSEEGFNQQVAEPLRHLYETRDALWDGLKSHVARDPALAVGEGFGLAALALLQARNLPGLARQIEGTAAELGVRLLQATAPKMDLMAQRTLRIALGLDDDLPNVSSNPAPKAPELPEHLRGVVDKQDDGSYLISAFDEPTFSREMLRFMREGHEPTAAGRWAELVSTGRMQLWPDDPGVERWNLSALDHYGRKLDKDGAPELSDDGMRVKPKVPAAAAFARMQNLDGLSPQLRSTLLGSAEDLALHLGQERLLMTTKSGAEFVRDYRPIGARLLNGRITDNAPELMLDGLQPRSARTRAEIADHAWLQALPDGAKLRLPEGAVDFLFELPLTQPGWRQTLASAARKPVDAIEWINAGFNPVRPMSCWQSAADRMRHAQERIAAVKDDARLRIFKRADEAWAKHGWFGKPSFTGAVDSWAGGALKGWHKMDKTVRYGAAGFGLGSLGAAALWPDFRFLTDSKEAGAPFLVPRDSKSFSILNYETGFNLTCYSSPWSNYRPPWPYNGASWPTVQAGRASNDRLTALGNLVTRLFGAEAGCGIQWIGNNDLAVRTGFGLRAADFTAGVEGKVGGWRGDLSASASFTPLRPFFYTTAVTGWFAPFHYSLEKFNPLLKISLQKMDPTSGRWMLGNDHVRVGGDRVDDWIKGASFNPVAGKPDVRDVVPDAPKLKDVLQAWLGRSQADLPPAQ